MKILVVMILVAIIIESIHKVQYDKRNDGMTKTRKIEHNTMIDCSVITVKQGCPEHYMYR